MIYLPWVWRSMFFSNIYILFSILSVYIVVCYARSKCTYISFINRIYTALNHNTSSYSRAKSALQTTGLGRKIHIFMAYSTYLSYIWYIPFLIEFLFSHSPHLSVFGFENNFDWKWVHKEICDGYRLCVF